MYETTPTVVYVGYTPAYLGCYPFDGVVVWGTGFYYTPWVGTYYCARPATWGFHARYYSWTGWTFGLSHNTGPFRFDLGWGGPHYTFYRGGWWGPGGYRGPAYVNVRNRWIRFNRAAGRSHNLYHRQGSVTRDRQAYRRQPAVVPRPAPG